MEGFGNATVQHPLTGIGVNLAAEGTIEMIGFEEIDVPAGEFNALHIRTKINFSDDPKSLHPPMMRWLAEGIGTVKQKAINSAGVSIEIKLREYRLEN